MIEVEITSDLSSTALNALTDQDAHGQVECAILKTLEMFGGEPCRISIAIVDNDRIREINQQFLQHDYATDVITFDLGPSPVDQTNECEIVVSAEMAIEQATRLGLSPLGELVLYVVHGTLHLCGLDDQDKKSAQAMRAAERQVLMELGFEYRFDSAIAEHVNKP